jgi:hypothetical protein
MEATSGSQCHPPVWTKEVPTVATTPKKANTNTSPSPRYPYGRGPPV